MSLNEVKDVVDIVSKVIVGAAALLGGIWAVIRLRTERVYEAALDIAVDTTCPGHGPTPLLFIAICLTNKGKVKIQAKTARDNGYAFNDGVEQLRHSFSLQLRHFNAVGAPPGHIDWYESPALAPVPGPPEINILYEYEDPRKGNQIDFWMEPGESSHFGVPVVVPPGLYLAKITFVGAGGDENYWSRIILAEVPSPGSP
jgi:hypothetical protein